MAVWSITNVAKIMENHRMDSEYFHPFYIEAEEKVSSLKYKRLGELGDFLIGPFGSAFHVSNYDPTSHYRYVRGKDVKPFALLDDDNVYMPEKDYNRLKKYALKPDDLLISVVGTLGNVAIVPSNLEGIFSCKSTVFRNSKIDPCYLLAYFNSTYGKRCLLRRQRGAIQAGINKDDLRTIPIPILDNIGELGGQIRRALDLRDESKDLYIQAQQLLEDELRLNFISLERPQSYTSSFSEVVNVSRFDAEYYNPQADNIYKAPCFKNAITLNSMFSILRGQTPAKYFKAGTPVLKTKNVRIPVIDEAKIEDYSNSTGNLVHIKNKDLILAAMGVGSLGRISYVFDDSSKAVIDGTLRILRVKQQYEKQIIPALLFLTSKYGQILIYKGIVGSTGIISLPDNYLKTIKIPMVKDNVATKITDLVISSYKARKDSDLLIEKAQKRIDEIIENTNKKE